MEYMRIKNQKKKEPGVNVMVSLKAHKVMSKKAGSYKPKKTLRQHVNIINEIDENE